MFSRQPLGHCSPMGAVVRFGRMRRHAERACYQVGLTALCLGVVLCVSGGVRGQDVAQLSALRIIQMPEGQADERSPVQSAVAFSSDGTLLATAGDDHVVRTWRVADGSMVREFREHTDWIRCIAFHPVEGLLASSGDDGVVALWDVASGRLLHAKPQGQAIAGLVFGNEGRTLAVVGYAEQVRLFDSQTGEVTSDLAGPSADLRAVAVSPDGRWLAAGGRNGRVRVWDLSNGNLVREIQTDVQRIRALAFSPDAAQLAMGGDGRWIHVWDPHGGVELAQLPSRPGKTLSLVYCAAGKLASGGSDNLIRIWDVGEARQESHLVGHTGSVTSLAFDKNHGLLASGSFDTTARIWDVGQPLRQARDKTPKSGQRQAARRRVAR